MDSTTSYHCVPKREYFATYKAREFGMVKMGNKSVSQIVGIGDIYIQTSMECTLTWKYVQHIPDLHLNLIFVHMLDRDGYNHFISCGNWKLTKGSLVVVRGKLCCSLYKTQGKVRGGQLNAVEDDTSPDLWHKRLAHISEKGLQLLASSPSFLWPKTNHQTPMTIAYLESNTNYHSERTPLEN